MITLKIKLQEILDNKNISVYSLSKEIGVTQNNLGKLVKGETTSIKYDILEKLCNILNITPNDIFEIEKPRKLFSDSTLQIINNLKEEKTHYYSYNSETRLSDFEKQAEHQEQKQKEDEENYQAYLENKDELDKFFSDSQKRFDSELELDKLVSDFIDNILDGLFTNLNFESSVKEIFESFKGYDYFTTKIKVEKFYDTFYRFLRYYSDDENFINILAKIKNIYAIGGLEKLSDETIIELTNSIKVYINNNPTQKD